MIDLGEFLSLSSESPSVVTSVQYVCSSMSELQYSLPKLFTKNNWSGDRLSSTLDALVLHLRIEFFIYKKYKI